MARIAWTTDAARLFVINTITLSLEENGTAHCQVTGEQWTAGPAFWAGTPLAGFTPAPLTTGSLQVTFDPNGSTYTPPATLIEWWFGDGNVNTDAADASIPGDFAFGTLPLTTHVYAVAGTYVVTLRITATGGVGPQTSSLVTVG